jgi:hypothetical protein
MEEKQEEVYLATVSKVLTDYEALRFRKEN